MKITDSVSSVLNSASKIVLIVLTVTGCAGFLMRILEPKDFMLLAIAVFSYYFGYKPQPPNNETQIPPSAVK